MDSYLDLNDRKRLRMIEQSQGIKIVNTTVVKYGYIFYGKDDKGKGRLRKYRLFKNSLVVT